MGEMNHGPKNNGWMVTIGAVAIGFTAASGFSESAQKSPLASPNDSALTLPSPKTQGSRPPANRAKSMVESLPLVAAPLGETDLRTIFSLVGLLPTPVGTQEQFDLALVNAIEVRNVARADLDGGEVARLKERLIGEIESQGYPTIAQSALVRSIRARALEIDLALIRDAARVLLDAGGPSAAEALVRACDIQATQAAVATLKTNPLGPDLLFVSVAPALVVLSGAQLDPQALASWRSLLASDGSARAALAARFSFAAFEGSALLAGKTAIDLQMALTGVLAAGKEVDSMKLVGIAMEIQLRDLLGVSAELAALDAAMVQAIQANPPTAVAFDVVSRLEDAAADFRKRQNPAVEVVRLAETAMQLNGISDSQKELIAKKLDDWKAAHIQAVLVQLQASRPYFAQVAASARAIVASDPTTWNLDNPAESERSQQRMAQRYEALEVERTSGEKFEKAVREILGDELSEQLPPISNGLAPQKKTP